MLSRIERLEAGSPPLRRQAPPAEEAAAPVAPPPVELSAARELWPAVVEQIKEGNAMLAHALAAARPVDVSERELVVAFPAGAEFNKRKAEQDEHRRMVADAVRTLSGRRLVPRYELRELEVAEPERLSDEGLVRRFMEEFNAEEILEDEGEAD